MKFRVYFDQINQQMYEIEAENKEEAIEKAERNWRKEFNNQQYSSIEDTE